MALLERGTFASPDYLSRFGMPRTPDDLAGHEMVGLLSPAPAKSFRSSSALAARRVKSRCQPW
jgi:hypothetical protein